MDRGEVPQEDPAPLESPVLLLVFNRPENARRVLDAVRGAKPKRLYIGADGPRDRPGEREKTEETRRLVLEGVDWDCEVHTLFREENLGVRQAVGGAIDWFFEHESEGIILEDDCLPGPSFFRFCDELLARYRDDDRVMQINGCCFLGDLDVPESYFFSNYPHIWGWATWKRAWAENAPIENATPEEVERVIRRFPLREERKYWARILDRYRAGKIDSWAYGWAFTIWKNEGLSVYPTRNLVRNIGFDRDAVHTKGWRDYRGLRRARLESIEVLRHPPAVERRPELDEVAFRTFFEPSSIPVRAFKILKEVLIHGRETGDETTRTARTPR